MVTIIGNTEAAVDSLWRLVVMLYQRGIFEGGRTHRRVNLSPLDWSLFGGRKVSHDLYMRVPEFLPFPAMTILLL